MFSRQKRMRICRAFQIEGLSLSKGALKAICSVLKSEPQQERALLRIIQALKGRIDRNETHSPVVSLDDITQVVADLTKDSEDLAQEGIQVFDAFKVPRLKYNAPKKEFFMNKEKLPLHGNAKEKMLFLRDRFTLIRQRLLRNETFAPPVPGSIKREYVELTPIESLRGTVGSKCVLGVLAELEEGKMFLEDLNSSVALDLSACQYYHGLFTQHCVVLCKGELVDDVFKASMMGFPPPEDRSVSLRHMANLNLLGLAPASQDFVHMQTLEEQTEDSMFVVVSNVHLDRPKVMEKLKELFTGYSAFPPTAFILIGNFMSRPFGHATDDMRVFKDHFDALAKLISTFPTLRKGSRFIFVPGPQDPSTGHPNVLPRPALPKVFTRRLLTVLPNAVFASNPCRLRYFTQEIVIFRENVLHKMRRNCVVQPKMQSRDGEGDEEGEEGEEEVDITDHLVKTICDQGHLCPMPLDTRPVYWAHDHSLWLYPLPDLVVMADNYDQYQQTYESCIAVNPGLFPTDFSFLVYRPASRVTEFSQIRS